MKRIIVLVCLLFLSACATDNNENKIKYTYTIESKKIDMSFYDGVNSVNNCFRLIDTKQLFETIEQKSSGIFLIGKEECGCCQNIVRYINEVGLDLNVTIYYIDVFNEDDPLVIYDENDKGKYSDNAYKLEEALFEILEERDGKRKLLTPHLFSIINGEFVGNQICTDFIEFDWDNTTNKDINNLKKAYYDLMKPFSK